MSNNLDFHACALGKGCHLNGGASRVIFREILGVNLVHAWKIPQVCHENRALYHVLKGQLLILQYGLHIFKHSLRLGFDIPFYQIAILGVYGDLTGTEQEVANFDGMIIRPHGGGGFCGFNDRFGCHKFVQDFPIKAWSGQGTNAKAKETLLVYSTGRCIFQRTSKEFLNRGFKPGRQARRRRIFGSFDHK